MYLGGKAIVGQWLGCLIGHDTLLITGYVDAVAFRKGPYDLIIGNVPGCESL